MDVIDAEYQCHKQNTSSQEKSCVNRASFVFMANFENFFLRFVNIISKFINNLEISESNFYDFTDFYVLFL